MKFVTKTCAVLVTALCSALPVQSAEIDSATEKSIAALSKQSGVSVQELREAVSLAEMQPKIIETITKPWESKPWYKYRDLFMIPKRISDGATFLIENEDVLAEAEKVYGVDREYITAILGVETFYGTRMGSYKLLDALYTLGFHYPKRSAYFIKEFANYVKLAKQQGWPLDERLGSYAGAMGMGQFMPSSYLATAVDFDNDGHKDLFFSKADAIGSIGNYFKKSGWKFHEPVAHAAVIGDRASVAKFINKELKTDTTWGALKAAGVRLTDSSVSLDDTQKVKLLELDGGDFLKLYYVCLPNFVSISRYNHSPLYVMAVNELAKSIKAEVADRKSKADSK